MPTYFFDLTVNGVREQDEAGVPLADPEAAKAEAYRVAGALAAEPNGREKQVLIQIRGEESGYFCEVELNVIVRDVA